MPAKIDKTRSERTGEVSFTGTGVGTLPDVMEENIDLRQMMQEMINDALAGVSGAVQVRGVPDQTMYLFGGGGVTQRQLDELYDDLQMQIYWIHFAIKNDRRRYNMLLAGLQYQIDNLKSGSGSIAEQLEVCEE